MRYIERLNAVEVLYLHYAVGRTPTDAVKHDFWHDKYLMTAHELLDALLEKRVLYKSDDYSIRLKKKTIPELKNILKDSNLKLGGNKDVLIKRIVDSEIDLDIYNLEKILCLTDNYTQFFEDTKFIKFGDFDKSIDIYELYKFYTSSPGKTDDEIIIGALIEKYKLRINEPNKNEAKILLERICKYYLFELKDYTNGYYYLNNYAMLTVLQNIERYRGMLAAHRKSFLESMDLSYLFRIENTTYHRYNSIYHSKKISISNMVDDLYADSKHLPYGNSDKNLASKFIAHYLFDDEEAHHILKNEIEKEGGIFNAPDELVAIGSVETGFRRFMKKIFK
ncbi:SAP domain-containing protein [Salinicoccus sp. CNSTN-B1]